jgi:hypothetical protein
MEDMSEVAGWNVWAGSTENLRKFSVACVTENEALSLVRQTVKDLQPVSREPLTANQIADLGLLVGQLLEWAPIGRGSKIVRGGTPLKKAIKLKV